MWRASASGCCAPPGGSGGLGMPALQPALLDVRLVEVGAPGLVNVTEAWCEVCDVRWFPPKGLRV